MDRLHAILARLRGALGRPSAATLRRLLPAALCVIFGVLFGVWVHAPIQAGLTRATRSLAASAGFRLEFAEASMGLFGPTLTTVRAVGPVTLNLDRVTVRPRWQTLILRPGVAISGRLGDGRLDLSLGAGGHDVAAAFTAFDLRDSGLGRDLKLGMALNGRIDGALSLSGDPQAPLTLTGTADLAIADARLDLPAGLPLPVSQITLGRIEARATFAEGNLKIGPVSVAGGDLDGSLRGALAMRQPLARSTADLRIRLEPGPRLAGTLGTYLPIAGFRRERDAWVRDYSGPLANLGL